MNATTINTITAHEIDLSIVQLEAQSGLGGELGLSTDASFKAANANLRRLAEMLSDQAKIISIMLESGREWVEITEATDRMNEIEAAWNWQWGVINTSPMPINI